MTSTLHQSGTDRCLEASQKIGGDFDVVINIQGDEPFIQPSQIESLKACFTEKSSTQLATLVKQFTPNDGLEALQNPNSPKVVINEAGEALYFSRSVVPYLRGVEPANWLEKGLHYKHIGIYAYRRDILKEIASLPPSPLELTESLEQLRWLENGYSIQTALTDCETVAVDTPEDLLRVQAMLAGR
jgi:3-deoxy-manno-octulosonate cytidylyltransferase (CMP-KDO synthetase)